MRKYFKFDGRIGRLEFLGAFGFSAAYLIAGLFLMGSGFSNFLSRLSFATESNVPSQPLFHVLECMLYIPAVWVMSAAWAKRLHDVGVSGWYQLILAVPGIRYMMLALFFMPSHPGPNKYGPGAENIP